MRVPTLELVTAAHGDRRAFAAFNVIHLETAEALVAAAESAGEPVILQISENCVDYHRALEPLARATFAIAAASTAPVAVHLDHAKRPELVFEAIDLGFDSVMYDGAELPFEENVATTELVVERARSRGVAVEAELGEVGGKNGAHTPGVRTDPDEARTFVERTGVDLLAVAVGSSHAMTERTAAIDLDLIARLRAASGVPLVLHGASGVPDALLLEGAHAGLAKINISTHLTSRFTSAIRGSLAADPVLVDSRKYLGAGRDAVADEASRLLTLFA